MKNEYVTLKEATKYHFAYYREWNNDFNASPEELVTTPDTSILLQERRAMTCPIGRFSAVFGPNADLWIYAGDMEGTPKLY